MAFYRSTKKQSGGASIDSLTVTTLPNKVNYSLDEPLDMTGAVITGTLDSMTGNVVNYCNYSPTVFTEEGIIPVTVSYYDKTTSFSVNCIDIGTLEETSWSKIQRVAAAGLGSQYWSVGDTKSIRVAGTVGNLAIASQTDNESVCARF